MMPSIADLEGVLSPIGFDQYIGASSKRLAAVVEPNRKEALASATTLLEGFDPNAFTDDELIDLFTEISSGFVESEDQAQDVDLSMSVEMLAMALEAYQEAVDQYGFEDAKGQGTSEELAQYAKTTAGAFLIERDQDLAAKVTARAYLWARSQREKGGTTEKAAKVETPIEFFEGAWGEKAELNYWAVSCGAWVGKARNAGILASFEKAKIEKAKIAAFIDERTSHICRFLNGKTIIVSSAIADTAGLVMPESTSNWLSESPPFNLGGLSGEDDRPRIRLPPTEPGKPGRLIATGTEPHLLGDGSLDTGTFEQYVTDEELAGILGPPPYHFLCRTLLLPMDWEDPLDLRPTIEMKPEPTT